MTKFIEDQTPCALLMRISSVIVESKNVEFIGDKFYNDSTPEIEYDLMPLRDVIVDSSSSKMKESKTLIKPRRSQHERKEKSLNLSFISSQALTFFG